MAKLNGWAYHANFSMAAYSKQIGDWSVGVACFIGKMYYIKLIIGMER